MKRGATIGAIGVGTTMHRLQAASTSCHIRDIDVASDEKRTT